MVTKGNRSHQETFERLKKKAAKAHLHLELLNSLLSGTLRYPPQYKFLGTASRSSQKINICENTAVHIAAKAPWWSTREQLSLRVHRRKKEEVDLCQRVTSHDLLGRSGSTWPAMTGATGLFQYAARLYCGMSAPDLGSVRIPPKPRHPGSARPKSRSFGSQYRALIYTVGMKALQRSLNDDKRDMRIVQQAGINEGNKNKAKKWRWRKRTYYQKPTRIRTRD